MPTPSDPLPSSSPAPGPSAGGPRVASLLPAATEIVCALGRAEALVGVSHECDHPPGVGGLPPLTRSRLGPAPTSGDLDRDLRALLAQALAVYEVDVEALAAVQPEVIVTQDLCGVCAVPLEAVRRAVDRALPGGAQVISLQPRRLEDVWEDVLRVARPLGVEGRGRELVDGLRSRLAALADRAPGGASVVTLEWLDPPMLGGLWSPELVAAAGGRTLGVEAGQHAPTVATEDLAGLGRPDLVLIKPCGFDLERGRSERGRIVEIVRTAGWDGVPVWLADGSALFNRPGPRLVESAEVLAACLHPEAFGDLAGLRDTFAERIL